MATQSFSQVEHIVVDGGSADETLEILKRNDVRWISEPDSGQSEAINKGLGLARGKVVGWLNADDTLTRDALHHVNDAFIDGAQWVYGKCFISGENEDTIWSPPRRLRERHFQEAAPIPQPSTFVSTVALQAVGRLDETLHLAMDYDLWIRLWDAGVRPTYIPHVLARFNVHPGSKTGAIPLESFMVEAVRVLNNSARPNAAGVMLGRAAARRAAAHEKLSREHLEEMVTEIRGEMERWAVSLPERAIRSGARAEALSLAIRTDARRAIRRFFSPGTLLYSPTRRRAFEAARIAVSKVVRR